MNRNTNINNISGNWRHDPSHRQGVRYNNAKVASEFGKGNQVRGGDRQSGGRPRPATATVVGAGDRR